MSVDRVRNVAPARKRPNCFREREEVREEDVGAGVAELAATSTVEFEDEGFGGGAGLDIVWKAEDRT